MRTLSARCGLNGTELRRGMVADADLPRLMSESRRHREMVAWVFAPGRLTTGFIADRIRFELERRDLPPLGAVFIDYVQQLSPMERTKNREQDLTRIADELLVISGRFNLPIIQAAQINRAGEGRSGDARRPRTNDIRESSGFGQNATGIMFVHRWDMLGEEGRPTEVVCTKNRNGQTGIVEVNFNKTTGMFRDTGGSDKGGW